MRGMAERTLRCVRCVAWWLGPEGKKEALPALKNPNAITLTRMQECHNPNPNALS